MDQADLVSQGMGGRRPEPEEVADRLRPRDSGYAVEAAGRQLLKVDQAPQLIRTARLRATG